MNKTFKSIAPGSSATIEVAGVDGTVTVYVHQNIGAIDLSATDAPAIALAILEAAGHRPVAYDPERLSGDDLLAYIAHKLAVHVGDEVKRAKEAADRSEAESLGRKLYNADRSACDLIWEDLAPASKRRWVDRMARAREIIEATK